MKQCLNCGKKGLFLKLYDGYCKDCIATRSLPLPTNELTTRFSFSVPDDVLSLLWFNDGKLKNFNSEKSLIGKIADKETTIRFTANEPSLISLSVPIADTSDGVEPLGYFPRYFRYSALSFGYELNEIQRRKYLEVLSDLDNPQNDIGYIFLFYYGLERHLLCGKADEAFNMIMRLRRTYKNKSFLSYSFMAILCAAIFKQRRDWAEALINASDDETVASADINALLLLNMAFGIDLSAKQIMLYARKFSFTNTRYIKDYPEVFEDCLKQAMQHTKRRETTELLNAGRLDIKTIPRFANQSIEAEMPIPDFIADTSFTGYYYSLLSEAHESVKQRLKDGTATKVDTTKQKPTKNFSIEYAPFRNTFDGNLAYQVQQDYNELLKLYAENKADFRYRIGSILSHLYSPTNAFWLLRDLKIIDKVITEIVLSCDNDTQQEIASYNKVYKSAQHKQGSENIKLLSAYIDYYGSIRAPRYALSKPNNETEQLLKQELNDLQQEEKRSQVLKNTTDTEAIKNKDDLKLFLEFKFEEHGYTVKKLTKGTAFVVENEAQTVLIESKYTKSKTTYAAIDTALTIRDYLNIGKLMVFSASGFADDLTEFAGNNNIKLFTLSEWRKAFTSD